VKYILVLGFGGFDHEGAGHREGHSGGMESVVNQSFGYIFLSDPSLFLDSSHIDDELMRTSFFTLNAGNLVMGLKSFHQIVSIKDSVSCGFANSCLTQHGDVTIRDG